MVVESFRSELYSLIYAMQENEKKQPLVVGIRNQKESGSKNEKHIKKILEVT